MINYVVVYKYLDHTRGEHLLGFFINKDCAERYVNIQHEKVNPKIGELEIREVFPMDGIEKLYYITPTCFYNE